MERTKLNKLAGCLFAAVAAIATIFPQTASADDEKVKIDKYYYWLDTENKTAELAPTEETDDYASGNLTIPATVKDGETSYRVTRIGDYAFSFCTSLTKVTIPTTITSIGAGAFQGCSKLATVVFQVSRVEEIGDAAFEGCSSLSSITLPSSVKKIGAWAFASCTSLKAAALHGGIKSVGKNAYMRCTSLTTATFACKLDAVPDGIFDHCTSLTRFAMPDSVAKNLKSIGVASFYDCPKLTSIEMGDSLVRVEVSLGQS